MSPAADASWTSGRSAPAKAIEVNWPTLLRLRLDAWRRWGEMLGEADAGGNPKGQRTSESDRLSDSDYQARHRARKLAFDVPDDAYFEYRAREDPDKLTLAGALRLVPAPAHDEPPPPEGKYRAIILDPPAAASPARLKVRYVPKTGRSSSIRPLPRPPSSACVGSNSATRCRMASDRLAAAAVLGLRRVQPRAKRLYGALLGPASVGRPDNVCLSAHRARRLASVPADTFETTLASESIEDDVMPARRPGEADARRRHPRRESTPVALRVRRERCARAPGAEDRSTLRPRGTC